MNTKNATSCLLKTAYIHKGEKMNFDISFNGKTSMDIDIPDDIKGNPMKISEYVYNQKLNLPEQANTFIDFNMRKIISDNYHVYVSEYDMLNSKINDALYLKSKYTPSGIERVSGMEQSYTNDYYNYIIIYIGNKNINKSKDDISDFIYDEYEKYELYMPDIKTYKQHDELMIDVICKDQPEAISLNLGPNSNDTCLASDIISLYLLKELGMKELVTLFENISVFEIIRTIDEFRHKIIHPETKEVLMTIITHYYIH